MLLTSLTIAALLSAAPVVFANANNVCSSVAADSDGDGFGWENNESCIVSDQSDDTPVFTNQENGQPVILTRAYWNAEDFNKGVVCKEDYFNGSSYATIRAEALLEFGLLSTVAPFEGTLDLTQAFRTTVISGLPWGLDDGIYSGPTGLGYSPWVEVIDIDYNNGVSTQAVRVWTSDMAYTRCRAINPGESFIPTGIPLIPDSEFNGDCIDTVPMGDGWGWDGSASCRIAAECVDTNPVGDGWGWDGSSSCTVTAR